MAENVRFEEKIQTLEALLAKMQAPDTGLEETVELYAQCADLVLECRAVLRNAELKIEEIGDILRENEAESHG